MTLQGVDHVQRDDSAAATVLRVDDRVGDQLLNEALHVFANRLVREASQSLGPSTAGNAPNRRGSEHLRGGIGYVGRLPRWLR